MKNVLLLGASGLIAPHIIPGLETEYNLKLADIKPHPDGVPVDMVDVREYDQVLEAMQGMDAVMNFTVLRHDDTLSFQVNTWGAYNVMKAVAETGIKKVIHSGPAQTLDWYTHDMEIPVDAPHAPTTDYYFITKHLSNEIVKSFARVHQIHTVCYLFQGLTARPTEPVTKRSVRDFLIIYDDLVHACKQGLELESVPDYYQEFNLHSHYGPNKYSLEKAERMLGYRPQEKWWDYQKRTP